MWSEHGRRWEWCPLLQKHWAGAGRIGHQLWTVCGNKWFKVNPTDVTSTQMHPAILSCQYRLSMCGMDSTHSVFYFTSIPTWWEHNFMLHLIPRSSWCNTALKFQCYLFLYDGQKILCSISFQIVYDMMVHIISVSFPFSHDENTLSCSISFHTVSNIT